jgi:hypothetical protein
MDFPQDQISQSDNPVVHSLFMVHNGNLVWLGILFLNRLALESTGISSLQGCIGFLYPVSSPAVYRD